MSPKTSKVNEVWSLGETICDIFVAVDVTCSTASILNLVAISIDRYLAIANPIAYSSASSSSTRAILTICLVWLISSAVGAPIILGLNTSPERTSDLCILYNPTFIFWSSLTSFYVPCLIMVGLYYRIFIAIRSRTKKAIESGAGGTNHASSAAAHHHTNNKNNRNINISIQNANNGHSTTALISPPGQQQAAAGPAGKGHALLEVGVGGVHLDVSEAVSAIDELDSTYHHKGAADDDDGDDEKRGVPIRTEQATKPSNNVPDESGRGASSAANRPLAAISSGSRFKQTAPPGAGTKRPQEPSAGALTGGDPFPKCIVQVQDAANGSQMMKDCVGGADGSVRLCASKLLLLDSSAACLAAALACDDNRDRGNNNNGNSTGDNNNNNSNINDNTRRVSSSSKRNRSYGAPARQTFEPSPIDSTEQSDPGQQQQQQQQQRRRRRHKEEQEQYWTLVPTSRQSNKLTSASIIDPSMTAAIKDTCVQEEVDCEERHKGFENDLRQFNKLSWLAQVPSAGETQTMTSSPTTNTTSGHQRTGVISCGVAVQLANSATLLQRARQPGSGLLVAISQRATNNSFRMGFQLINNNTGNGTADELRGNGVDLQVAEEDADTAANGTESAYRSLELALASSTPNANGDKLGPMTSLFALGECRVSNRAGNNREGTNDSSGDSGAGAPRCCCCCASRLATSGDVISDLVRSKPKCSALSIVRPAEMAAAAAGTDNLLYLQVLRPPENKVCDFVARDCSSQQQQQSASKAFQCLIVMSLQIVTDGKAIKRLTMNDRESICASCLHTCLVAIVIELRIDSNSQLVGSNNRKQQSSDNKQTTAFATGVASDDNDEKMVANGLAVATTTAMAAPAAATGAGVAQELRAQMREHLSLRRSRSNDKKLKDKNRRKSHSGCADIKSPTGAGSVAVAAIAATATAAAAAVHHTQSQPRAFESLVGNYSEWSNLSKLLKEEHRSARRQYMAEKSKQAIYVRESSSVLRRRGYSIDAIENNYDDDGEDDDDGGSLGDDVTGDNATQQVNNEQAAAAASGNKVIAEHCDSSPSATECDEGALDHTCRAGSESLLDDTLAACNHYYDSTSSSDSHSSASSRSVSASRSSASSRSSSLAAPVPGGSDSGSEADENYEELSSAVVIKPTTATAKKPAASPARRTPDKGARQPRRRSSTALDDDRVKSAGQSRAATADDGHRLELGSTPGGRKDSSHYCCCQVAGAISAMQSSARNSITDTAGTGFEYTLTTGGGEFGCASTTMASTTCDYHCATCGGATSSTSAVGYGLAANAAGGARAQWRPAPPGGAASDCSISGCGGGVRRHESMLKFGGVTGARDREDAESNNDGEVRSTHSAGAGRGRQRGPPLSYLSTTGGPSIVTSCECSTYSQSGRSMELCSACKQHNFGADGDVVVEPAGSGQLKQSPPLEQAPEQAREQQQGRQGQERQEQQRHLSAPVAAGDRPSASVLGAISRRFQRLFGGRHRKGGRDSGNDNGNDSGRPVIDVDVGKSKIRLETEPPSCAPLEPLDRPDQAQVMGQAHRLTTARAAPRRTAPTATVTHSTDHTTTSTSQSASGSRGQHTTTSANEMDLPRQQVQSQLTTSTGVAPVDGRAPVADAIGKRPHRVATVIDLFQTNRRPDIAPPGAKTIADSVTSRLTNRGSGKHSNKDNKLTSPVDNQSTTNTTLMAANQSSNQIGQQSNNNKRLIITRRRREKNAARRERKATKTLAIVLCIFLVCWTPFFTCNIIDGICIQLNMDCNWVKNLYSMTTWLGYINSCLNPIIYTIFNMEFRRAFKRILNDWTSCCKFMRCCSIG